MGSHSYITFSDYPIYCFKNGYYEFIVNRIFLPDDFLCERREYSSRNRLVWRDAYDKEKGTFEFKKH